MFWNNTPLFTKILTLTRVAYSWKIWAYYSQFADGDYLHRDSKTHSIHGHPHGTECQPMLSFLTQRLLENVSRVNVFDRKASQFPYLLRHPSGVLLYVCVGVLHPILPSGDGLQHTIRPTVFPEWTHMDGMKTSEPTLVYHAFAKSDIFNLVRLHHKLQTLRDTHLLSFVTHVGAYQHSPWNQNGCY